jgi:tungstate transport system ATP-binding protein
MIEWRKGVELEGVGQNYGTTAALAGLNVSLSPGMIYGILGPNGSGKSTLLRLIALLEKPTLGTMVIAGINPWAVDSGERLGLAREMTMMAQKPVLLSATVEDNIAYGLKLRKIPAEQVRDRVREAADLLEVSHLLRRFAPRLSGGEAQRVAAARALVIKPRLLLLDEPTASLDPAQVRVLENAVRTINRRDQTTVVMVTHNIGQAQRLAQEVLFFHQGHLVEKTQAERFFAQPQQALSQEFLQSEGFRGG